MGGQPGAGVNLPPESGLAGGGGRVLAADIWCIRKRVLRPPRLLAGALGLGSGDTEYQPATLALLRLDLPSPVLLRKQTHSSAEQGTQRAQPIKAALCWGTPPLWVTQPGRRVECKCLPSQGSNSHTCQGHHSSLEGKNVCLDGVLTDWSFLFIALSSGCPSWLSR